MSYQIHHQGYVIQNSSSIHVLGNGSPLRSCRPRRSTWAQRPPREQSRSQQTLPHRCPSGSAHTFGNEIDEHWERRRNEFESSLEKRRRKKLKKTNEIDHILAGGWYAGQAKEEASKTADKGQFHLELENSFGIKSFTLDQKFYFGSSLDHGSGVGDWRKGSADIKLLLKNLYSQSPMPHTDVTFKVICIIGNSIIIHCNFTVRISLTKTQLQQSLFMRKKIS